jgi:hypothetical protein
MLFLIIGQRFNVSRSFNYTPYLFYKKRFKSEINSFWVHIQKELIFGLMRKNEEIRGCSAQTRPE